MHPSAAGGASDASPPTQAAQGHDQEGHGGYAAAFAHAVHGTVHTLGEAIQEVAAGADLSTALDPEGGSPRHHQSMAPAGEAAAGAGCETCAGDSDDGAASTDEFDWEKVRALVMVAAVVVVAFVVAVASLC